MRRLLDNTLPIPHINAAIKIATMVWSNVGCCNGVFVDDFTLEILMLSKRLLLLTIVSIIKLA